MGDESIVWYRIHVCQAEHHKHGKDGEMQCMLERYLKLSKGAPAPA